MLKGARGGIVDTRGIQERAVFVRNSAAKVRRINLDLFSYGPSVAESISYFDKIVSQLPVGTQFGSHRAEFQRLPRHAGHVFVLQAECDHTA
jgi:hypothetical protein